MFNCELWDGDPEDLEGYAKLLQEEYGDSRLNKGFLHWKHLVNPLGKSILAFAKDEGGRIVAGRAFWYCAPGGVVVVQPCDTVTHRDARRQGLFERLTKLCLSECQPEWIVLNFPNEQSRPGYLKLGWHVYSQQNKIFSYGFGRQPFVPIADFFEIYKECFSKDWIDYLSWRLLQHPHFSYEACLYGESVLVRRGERYSSFVLPGHRILGSRMVIPVGNGIGYSHKHSRGLRVSREGIAVVARSKSYITYYPTNGSYMLGDVLDNLDGSFLVDTF